MGIFVSYYETKSQSDWILEGTAEDTTLSCGRNLSDSTFLYTVDKGSTGSKVDLEAGLLSIYN